MLFSDSITHSFKACFIFTQQDDENRSIETDFSQRNDDIPEMFISTLNAQAQVAVDAKDIDAMTETYIEQNAPYINDEHDLAEIFNNKNEECYTKMYSEHNVTDDVMSPRSHLVNSIVMTSRELNMANSLVTPRGQIINGVLWTPRDQIITEDGIQLEMAMTLRNLENNDSERDEAENEENSSGDVEEEKTENRNSVKHKSRTSEDDDTSVPNIQI